MKLCTACGASSLFHHKDHDDDDDVSDDYDDDDVDDIGVEEFNKAL